MSLEANLRRYVNLWLTLPSNFYFMHVGTHLQNSSKQQIATSQNKSANYRIGLHSEFS